MSSVHFHGVWSKNAHINPDDYEITQYEGNGGVVCLHRETRAVLIFISCEVLGYTHKQNASRDFQPEIRAKGELISHEIITVHNRALQEGMDAGRKEKMAEIKMALEL